MIGRMAWGWSFEDLSYESSSGGGFGMTFWIELYRIGWLFGIKL